MNRKKWLIFASIIAICSFFAGRISSGISTISADEKSPYENTEQLKTLEWLNESNPLDYATYQITYYSDKENKNIKKTAKFFNGSYLYPKDGRGYAHLENGTIGNLDSDSELEGVVMLESNGGGTGFFPELVVLKKQVDGYVQIASTSEPDSFFADRIIVNSIKIEDKIITVNITGKGPDDPGCCPTIPMEMKFKFANNKIEVLK